MTSVYTGIALAAAAGLVAWAYPRFLAPESNRDSGRDLTIRLRELPKLFRALKTTGMDESYAGTLVPPLSGRDPLECAYVQFSIENDRVGFDWVLESEQNRDDRGRFTDLARTLGYRLEEREQNGVRYLRVEEGDLPRLAASVLEQLYGLTDRDTLTLQVEGFSYENRDAAV